MSDELEKFIREKCPHREPEVHTEYAEVLFMAKRESWRCGVRDGYALARQWMPMSEVPPRNVLVKAKEKVDGMDFHAVIFWHPTLQHHIIWGVANTDEESQISYDNLVGWMEVPE